MHYLFSCLLYPLSLFIHPPLLHLSLTHDLNDVFACVRAFVCVCVERGPFIFLSNNASLSLMRRNGHRRQPVSPCLAVSIPFQILSLLWPWSVETARCSGGFNLVFLLNGQHLVWWSDVCGDHCVHQLRVAQHHLFTSALSHQFGQHEAERLKRSNRWYISDR